MTITRDEIIAEELRADLWRAQVERRAAFQRELWASLAAPSGPRDQQWANWAAYLEWRQEMNLPAVDPCDDPDVDPLGISDTVNVGE